MTKNTTRRNFIKRTALASGIVAAPSILAERSPNSKLGIAVIGSGGMGSGNPAIAASERFVAMCDIDEGRIAKAAKSIADKVPNPKVYYDYRKMIEECQKDIDLVLIATPDHHHAPAAIRAIDLGKAVFCQKPLAHNIAECYKLAKAAEEKKVLTQMGNQGHFGENIRQVCEYIWAGAIGKVTEVHALLGRNFGGSGGRPASKPVPGGIHWDEWLGPAPKRDFHDGLHPFSWRTWRQFGTGTVGDMACHNLDTLFWALKLGEAPQVSIECLNTKGGSEEKYPQDNVVRWKFGARGDMAPVEVHCYDHKELMPEVMLEAQRKYNIKFNEHTLFVGEQGMITISGTSGRWQFLPGERIKGLPVPAKTLPRTHGGPIHDLIHACKHGTKPCSDFPGSAAPLSAFAATGHLAAFAGVGKKLQWDVKKMKCTNDSEINRLVRREYRPGWEV